MTYRAKWVYRDGEFVGIQWVSEDERQEITIEHDIFEESEKTSDAA